MLSRLFLALALTVCSWPTSALADDVLRADVATAATTVDGPVGRFYQLHGEGQVWQGNEQALADAQVALDVLSNSLREGLDPERYRVFRSGNITTDDAALTGALLTYMRDLALGRPDLEALDADVALPQRSFDPAYLLDQALRQHRLAAMLTSLTPPYDDYGALKAELAHDPRWAECRGDHGQHGTLALVAPQAGDRTASLSMPQTPHCNYGLRDDLS